VSGGENGCNTAIEVCGGGVLKEKIILPNTSTEAIATGEPELEIDQLDSQNPQISQIPSSRETGDSGCE